MKKIIAITLMFVLVLALSACGGKDKPTAEAVHPVQEVPASEVPVVGDDSADSGDASGGAAANSLIDWMINGKYSYDYELTSDASGQIANSTGSIAADGKNYAISTAMEVSDMKVITKVVVKDGETYVISDDSKTVIKMSAASADMTAGQMMDYSGIVPSGSGTGEFNGKTLPYEEYTSEGGSVKYFIDGGQVCGFESEYQGYKSTMIITNASNSVPAGAFDIPADYTEISY